MALALPGFLRVKVELSCRRWVSSGADLHVAPHSLYSVGWFNDCVWRSRSCLLLVCGLKMLLPRGEVLTMTHVRCLNEALFVEVWVEFLVCAAQRFCDSFYPIFH
jgi:hypothetical protein